MPTSEQIKALWEKIAAAEAERDACQRQGADDRYQSAALRVKLLNKELHDLLLESNIESPSK